MALFIIIYIVLYTILSIKRLDWAVFVILAALPSYQIRFSVLGIPSTLLESMILIAFAVWVVKNRQDIIGNIKNRLNRKSKIPVPSEVEGKNQKLQRYPFDIEIALVLIISWIAVLVAGFSNPALGLWKAYFFEPILLFILLLNIFQINSVSTAFSPLRPKGHLPLVRGGNLESIMWALMISAFWVSGMAIIERISGLFSVEAFWPRVTGPFLYPNALGLYLGPLVLVMIGWVVAVIARRNVSDDTAIPSDMDARDTSGLLRFARNDRFIIVFVGVTIIMSVVSIYFARSEGAAVGILAGLFVFVIFWLFSKLKKELFSKILLWNMGLMLLIILVYPLIVLNIYPKYYHPTFKYEALNYVIKKTALKDLSGEIRKQQWRETWVMLKGDWTWLTGTGLSDYQTKVKPYHQEGIFFNFDDDPKFRDKIVWWDDKYKGEHWQPVEIYMYPHSTVLNFWTELGLMGALLFVWIIVRYFIICAQLVSRRVMSYELWVMGLAGAMVVLIVHGMVDVVYFKNDLAIIFWVLVALLGILSIREKYIPK